MTDETPRDVWNAKQREDRREMNTEYTLGELEHRFKRFVKQMLVVVAIIGFLCALGLFCFGVILRDQDRTAIKLEQQTEMIQAQRYEAAFNICTQRNDQNVGIRKVLRANGTDEATIALFPKTDCAQYADKTVNDRKGIGE